MSLPNNLSLQDQPKLDSNFTKGRFANQVHTAQCRNAIFFLPLRFYVKIQFTVFDTPPESYATAVFAIL